MDLSSNLDQYYHRPMICPYFLSFFQKDRKWNKIKLRCSWENDDESDNWTNQNLNSLLSFSSFCFPKWIILFCHGDKILKKNCRLFICLPQSKHTRDVDVPLHKSLWNNKNKKRLFPLYIHCSVYLMIIPLNHTKPIY